MRRLSHAAKLLLDHATTETLLNARYKLLYPIGQGGFAIVYEALDLKLDQRVAIKTLKPDADPAHSRAQAWRARFAQEIKLTARCPHPNITRVFDSGDDTHDNPFLVMELLQGHTLEHELWTRGAMTTQRAIALSKRMLHALASMHITGLVHRDLKPSNLFLVHPRSEAEDIKLLDLGLAYDLNLDPSAPTRHTQDDVRVGTPLYFAPEYERDGYISPSLDVYQAALVIMELCTGPRKQLDEDLNARLSALPPQLAQTLSIALSDDPDERYPDATALLQALKDLDLTAPEPEALQLAQTLDDLPARPLSAPTSSTITPPKRPWPRWGIIAALITLATLATLALIALNRINTAQPIPAPAPQAQKTPAPTTTITQPQTTPAPTTTITQPQTTPAPTPAIIAPEAAPDAAPDQAPSPKPTHRPATTARKKAASPAPTTAPATTTAAPTVDEALSKELRWIEHGEH